MTRSARPLQPVALGLVVVVLSARFSGYDALADPVGWLLVLAGLAAMPADLEHRRLLLGLAGLSGLVSVPLWLPEVAAGLARADLALAWAVNLPQLGLAALLCLVLARRADAAADRTGRWLRLAAVLTVVVALLPVLVLGAGVTALVVPAAVTAVATGLVVIVLLLRCAARPWAGATGEVGGSAESPAAGRSGP